MPSDQTEYDLFISYARRDNAPRKPEDEKGWVTAIKDHILEDHRRFTTEPLRIFFDTEEIRDADDWRNRILGALRESKILLVCLSPSYFGSDYCRWEWEEYIRRQVHQLMGSDSMTTVYFVELPDSPEAEAATWREELLSGNYTDLRPWFPEGTDALRLEDVRQRMAGLGDTLWDRMQRARRASAVPGNLRWQNPHFVGRKNELRELHAELGTGAVGVVTAVQGLGGQGKTELAVAYAHGWADCYPAGLWSLSAEDHKELLPLLGELAWERELGFTPTEAEKSDPQLLGRAVLDHLRKRCDAVQEKAPDQGASCLILLDNVTEDSLLAPDQLTTLPGGLGAGWLRIVATTRLPTKPQKERLAVLAVDALDEESAQELIRDHQPFRDAGKHPVTDPEDSVPKGVPSFASEAEEAAAREIVRELDGFTLAVEQVALYLGLHPEVSPAAFLAILRERGLAEVTSDLDGEEEVSARMLTQSKQLGFILEETISRLDEPARTALEFAALLPPDNVPWPWLRALTLLEHPELAVPASLGADPWHTIQRQLSGFRLITPGDRQGVNRIHRLIAAQLQQASKEHTLDRWLSGRAPEVHQSTTVPHEWELDALIVALPYRFNGSMKHSLAVEAIFMAEKFKAHRALPTAADLLKTAHAILLADADSDPSNSEWQRDVSVSYEMIGDLMREQGKLQDAFQAYRFTLAIRERLSSDDPSNRGWQYDLSRSHEKVGDVMREQGKVRDSFKSYQLSMAIRERLSSDDPSNAIWRSALSASHSKIGDVLCDSGKLQDALEAYRLALAMAERLAKDDPSNRGWRRDLCMSNLKIGDVLRSSGKLQDALEAYRLAMAIAERLTEEDPSNFTRQFDLSVSHIKVGDILRDLGKLQDALKAFRLAMAVAERLAKDDPSNATWQRNLSVSQERIGDILRDQGKLEDALEVYRSSMAVAERLAMEDPSNAGWQRDLSMSQDRIGNALYDQGKLEDALETYHLSMAIRERLAMDDPSNATWQHNLSISQEKIGDVLLGQGQLEGALKAYRSSMTIRKRLAADDLSNATWQHHLCISQNKIGDVLLKQGKLKDAVEAYQLAIATRERLPKEDLSNGSWQHGLSLSQERVGDVLLKQGKLEEALKAYQISMTIRKRLASNDPSNASWQRALAGAHQRLAIIARESGDDAGCAEGMRNCFEVLDAMKERGLHFDPNSAQVYEQLKGIFGD